MGARVSTVSVTTPDQMREVATGYVAQGFVVSTQTETSTTMFKKKEFNILWAVIGFFLCLLPLLIYCIVYAMESDQMVIIRVGTETATPDTGHLTWSEDRRYWWDGQTWVDADQTPPPGALHSERGDQWWDGTMWRPATGATLAPGRETLALDADDTGAPSSRESE
jgi:hypothetical protein